MLLPLFPTGEKRELVGFSAAQKFDGLTLNDPFVLCVASCVCLYESLTLHSWID